MSIYKEVYKTYCKPQGGRAELSLRDPVACVFRTCGQRWEAGVGVQRVSGYRARPRGPASGLSEGALSGCTPHSAPLLGGGRKPQMVAQAAGDVSAGGSVPRLGRSGPWVMRLNGSDATGSGSGARSPRPGLSCSALTVASYQPSRRWESVPSSSDAR